MYKILIVDHRFPSLKYEKMIFSEIGDRLLDGQYKNEEDVINFAKRNRSIDVLLVLFISISKKVFKDLHHLKVIGRYGIGIDMIDIKEATKNKVCIVMFQIIA
jgi:D-3-phosphoglycerate dehydrogenase